MSKFSTRLLEKAKGPDFWRQRISLRPGILPLYYRLTSPSGVAIMEEEWDILIILDACRFDIYETHAAEHFDGQLESRRSQASATPNFLRFNFADDMYHDTVYVTANPQVNIQIDAEEIFHDVVSVWESDWDTDKGTVRPKPMADRVIEAAAEYPNKRLIAHFVQPHYPFLGEISKQLDDPGINGEIIDGLVGQDSPDDRTNIWRQIKQGSIPSEIVWQAYTDTLEAVIPSVKHVLSEASGQTVITADHGNMFGERAGPIRIFGHPGNILTTELTRVPWHIIPGDRREIVSDPPRKGDSTDEAEVKDQLEALGYVD